MQTAKQKYIDSIKSPAVIINKNGSNKMIIIKKKTSTPSQRKTEGSQYA